MKNVYKLTLAAIAASIFLVGCGSNSSSTEVVNETETVTGQFVDTYVSGLNYVCSSGMTGITNDMGEYTCNVGDSIEFSLGGYVLGSTTASQGIVTPETLYPENPEAALNVAQVIQSLDTDPTDDIITIPDNFTDLDDVTVTPEDTNFDTLIEDELNVPLVTEEEAQDHLDETTLILSTIDKTKYFVTSLGVIGQRNYAADGTYTANFTLANGTELDTSGTYTIDNSVITINRTSPNTLELVLTYTGEESGGLGFTGSINGGEEFQTVSFDTAAQRDAYMTSYLESFIVGKTKYFANSQGITGVRTYAADGTYMGSVTLTDGTVLDVSGTYTIENNVIIINRTSPNTLELVLTYTGEESGGLGFLLSVNDGDEITAASFDTAAQRDTYLLKSLIVDKRKYFANTEAGTGYRDYAADGSYTGEVTLGNGTVLTVSGTYVIENNVVTINRTSPNTLELVLTYTGMESGGLGFDISIGGADAIHGASFDTAAQRDAYLTSYMESLFVGKTKYFANSKGGTGFRVYSGIDNTYTGSAPITAGGTPVDVSGTYSIVNNVLNINRISPVNTTLVLTYIGTTDGIITMNITVNAGAPFETREFDTEAERDAYVASLVP